MGNHDADRSIIEHREDAVRIRPRNPYEPRRAEGPGPEEADLERLPRPGRMLFVQHDEVIADRAEYLGGVRGRRFAERADQELAIEQSLAELAWRGALRGGCHDGWCLD